MQLNYPSRPTVGVVTPFGVVKNVKPFTEAPALTTVWLERDGREDGAIYVPEYLWAYIEALLPSFKPDPAHMGWLYGDLQSGIASILVDPTETILSHCRRMFLPLLRENLGHGPWIQELIDYMESRLRASGESVKEPEHKAAPLSTPGGISTSIHYFSVDGLTGMSSAGGHYVHLSEQRLAEFNEAYPSFWTAPNAVEGWLSAQQTGFEFMAAVILWPELMDSDKEKLQVHKAFGLLLVTLSGRKGISLSAQKTLLAWREVFRRYMGLGHMNHNARTRGLFDQVLAKLDELDLQQQAILN